MEMHATMHITCLYNIAGRRRPVDSIGLPGAAGGCRRPGLVLAHG